MYGTVEGLKEYLGITASTDDQLLEGLLKAASAFIDHFCGRWFEAREETRKYGPEALVGDVLHLDAELLQVRSITNGDGSEVTEYILLPRNAGRYTAIKARGWNATAGDIAVSGLWGYSVSPPPDIVHAAIRLAAYYYRQRDAQVFDVTALPDQGAITVPKGIPADVRSILGKYKRLW